MKSIILGRRATLLLVCLVVWFLRVVAVAATSVTIAVTGDVHTPDAKMVADVIRARQPLDAVLLTGDTYNGQTATLPKYQEIYRGSYDRFLSIIFPSPGNHDQRAEPPFSGYQAFWGAAAHPPTMYYSFNRGGWHIISLDSVSFRGEAPATSQQLAWLKTDLAANAKKPVIAYWHYPYFSRAKHGGTPAMKPFWQALEAHGAALVFSGHNHAYERFPPLDAEGRPADPARGVQQFVISPGGATPAQPEKENANGPAPAVSHGGTQHVGFFVLHPDGGYSFTIESVDKSRPTAIVDQGEGKLQPD